MMIGLVFATRNFDGDDGAREERCGRKWTFSRQSYPHFSFFLLSLRYGSESEVDLLLPPKGNSSKIDLISLANTAWSLLLLLYLQQIW